MRTGAGTAVEGGAADAPPLDQRDLCAQLGGVQGGGHTSGAAPNDDNPHLACSFRDPCAAVEARSRGRCPKVGHARSCWGRTASNSRYGSCRSGVAGYGITLHSASRVPAQALSEGAAYPTTSASCSGSRHPESAFS